MTDTPTPKRLVVYADGNGREPCREWLNGLRDRKGRRCIKMLHFDSRGHKP
jgi:hypothetical protein